MKKAVAIIVGAILAVSTFGLLAGANAADNGQTAPVTPATEWHGLPGNNGGFSDQDQGACPASNGNDGCDGGIHGIANNPGQSGNSPADQGVPACNMHGGFNGEKRQCP